MLANGAFAGEEKKLCLTMIVKNESAIIERCLESVKDIVDVVSICDTGSTDNTVEVIVNFLQKNNIPGKVHKHEWQNFGHNRTLSAEAAKQTINELNFSPKDTYLLFLDADMVLEIGKDFDKTQLVDDGYLVQQKFQGYTYYNLRLGRAHLPWKSVGVTHEYWSSQSPDPPTKLNSLVIDDREDGGCKTDKFERDLKLLTKGLQDEPENERYMFYCAQVNKTLKKYDEAVRLFKARIEKGGWIEEVWYSKFLIGECYAEMGFWDQALHWYLDAYEYNPARAEPLQKIATHYRLDAKNQLAYLFAKHASKIPKPENQILFLSNAVYDYQLDEELSIASFYTPFKEDGLIASNKLLLKKTLPQNVRDQTVKNILFYVENLKNASFQPIVIDLPLLREGSSETYLAMNPSIQKTEEGYTLICRTVNWSQKGGKDYQSRDPLDPTIRTKNFLVFFDTDFQLVSQKEMIENEDENRSASHVQGLEDCRLVQLNHEDWFTCTTNDTKLGVVSQSLGKMVPSSPLENTVFVEKLIQLKGINPTCEKNWLPFEHKNALFAIYSYDPFVVLKIEKETGVWEKVIEYNPPFNFSRFRGSASPIPFDEGFLLLVHEVTINDERMYTHRFVYLDQNFSMTKVSKPFTFLHKGIEYCCGMTLDHSEKNCLMTIGIEDKEALICTVSLETIREMLEVL